MKVNLDLWILNDCRENQAILMKLPEHLVTRWSCQDYRDSTGMYPTFSTFSDFIARQARLSCDPITSFQALKEDKTSKSTDIKSKETVLSTETKEKEKSPWTNDDKKGNRRPCILCQRNHWLGFCEEFKRKSVSERREFAKKKGFCFNCLTPKHLAKECKSKYRFRICKNMHTPCLHFKDDEKKSQDKRDETKVNELHTKEKTEKAEPVISHSTRTKGGNKSCMVVPVFVSHFGNRSNKVLTYALPDTQSSISFVSTGVAEKLQVTGEETELILSTMSANEEVS